LVEREPVAALPLLVLMLETMSVSWINISPSTAAISVLVYRHSSIVILTKPAFINPYTYTPSSIYVQSLDENIIVTRAHKGKVLILSRTAKKTN